MQLNKLCDLLLFFLCIYFCHLGAAAAAAADCRVRGSCQMELKFRADHKTFYY